jgi:tetratricopeptide (TPR) repeat protein
MMNFNMENYKTAAGAFEQAARLGRPVDADLYLNLGMAHLKQAAYDDAIRNLLSALALRPKDVQVMTNLANAWYKKQDFKNAITQWNNILLQQPLNGFAMFMLGRSYICSGEIARGQAICDQALTLGER